LAGRGCPPRDRAGFRCLRRAGASRLVIRGATQARHVAALSRLLVPRRDLVPEEAAETPLGLLRRDGQADPDVAEAAGNQDLAGFIDPVPACGRGVPAAPHAEVAADLDVGRGAGRDGGCRPAGQPDGQLGWVGWK
jgi:hypothetical protein